MGYIKRDSEPCMLYVQLAVLPANRGWISGQVSSATLDYLFDIFFIDLLI